MNRLPASAVAAAILILVTTTRAAQADNPLSDAIVVSLPGASDLREAGIYLKLPICPGCEGGDGFDDDDDDDIFD